MTIDWTGALVLVTGFAGLCGAFAYVTKLLVRSEIAKMHDVFVPRTEAELRDAEIERRLQAVGL